MRRTTAGMDAFSEYLVKDVRGCETRKGYSCISEMVSTMKTCSMQTSGDVNGKSAQSTALSHTIVAPGYSSRDGIATIQIHQTRCSGTRFC
jgi:hypothetical protein